MGEKLKNHIVAFIYGLGLLFAVAICAFFIKTSLVIFGTMFCITFTVMLGYATKFIISESIHSLISIRKNKRENKRQRRDD